MRYLWTVE